MGATPHLFQPEHPSKPAINSLAGSKRQNNISNSAGAAQVFKCSITCILLLPSPWERRKGSVLAAVCKCAADTSFHLSPPWKHPSRAVTPSPAPAGLRAQFGCKPARAWPQDNLKPRAKMRLAADTLVWVV